MLQPQQIVDIRYAIAGRAQSLYEAHPIWAEALPVSLRRMPDDAAPLSPVTHGQYFQAIRHYLLNEGIRHLAAAVAQTLPNAAPFSIPERIDVILEKHGEFYHPAQIQIPGPDGPRNYVLNVAATPVGLEYMVHEIEALERVAARLPEGSVPRVYGASQVENPDGPGFRMFLGDWFEGHHEFHLSIDPSDGAQKIVVWDNRREPYFLPAPHARDVYFQAAYILTRAYDPVTTRQIYPWHHASGDFILQYADKRVQLKLISVRQYALTLGGEGEMPMDEESRVMAAVVFFANLTLRNRIDRLDGTGELAWARGAAVDATVAGFQRALSESASRDLAPLLLSYGADDWATLLKAVAVQYMLMPAEEALFERHIDSHAASLVAAIRRANAS